MKLRDVLGDRYEDLRLRGAASRFLDFELADLDKDDLLALIGWLGEDRQRNLREVLEMRSLRGWK